MNNLIQPALITDVFGETTENPFFSMSEIGQLSRIMSNRREAEPVKPQSYDNILKNMNLKKKQEDDAIDENEKNEIEDTDKLNKIATEITKKIVTTRNKLKEINNEIKNKKETLSKCKELRTNFTNTYKELFALLIKNESVIHDDVNFTETLIGETYIIEENSKTELQKLEEKKADVLKLLSTLNEFVIQATKTEMCNDDISGAQQSVNKCGICIENNIGYAFNPCGHTICASCAGNVFTCHICRTRVVNKIKLFF
jgi:hypothetical protein